MAWAWDWSDFKKPHVVIGLTASVIVGGSLVWYTNVHQIPDLVSREDKQDKDLNGKFTEISGQVDKQFAAMRADLSAMDGRYQDRLKKMDLSIAGLKVNMTRVCVQRHSLSKVCSPDALAADIKSATRAQAQFFDSAKVTLTAGAKVPQVTSQAVKAMLGWTPDYAYVAESKSGQPDLADVILWSSAADSAHWRQEGNTVKTDFANGAATLMLGESASKEEKQALVDSLNATVAAINAGSTKLPDKK
jgi:hypothetical protein